MHRPKLLLLNGFAGSGKSTVAKRYIVDHKLALVVEGDQLIVNLGSWLDYEDEARELVYAIIKSIITTHLSNGYDVVLPYLVTDSHHVDTFAQIAKDNGASFHNFYLSNDKETAIQNLLERGTWGEEGTDPITMDDMPLIERIYSTIIDQLADQHDIVTIKQSGLSVEATYQHILRALL